MSIRLSNTGLRLHSILRGLVVLFTLFCFAGCTSMQAVRAPVAASARTQIKKGDDIAVWMRGGQHFELKVTAVEDTGVTGRDDQRKAWKLPYADIERMEVRRVDGVKTTTMVVGALAVVAALWVAAIRSAGDSLSDGLGGK
ncbi:hypothetical protein AAG565_14825 [Fontimonas sp. SYSU GA230001]|uniref:hypothetical protein n=1 Tax=Fontimonas sp. SYSU GA230001 TaxID=3142450 RepID=UPI0032B33173